MSTSDTVNLDGKSTGGYDSLPPSGYKRSTSTGEHHLNQLPHGMKSGHSHQHQRAYGYPPHYSSSRPPHPIQAVVTNSFSMEEDREDGSSRHHGGHGITQYPHPEYHLPYEGRQHDHRDGARHMHRREDSHSAFEPPQSNRDHSHYSRELPPSIHDSDMDRRMHMHDDRHMMPHEDRHMQPHDDRRVAPPHDTGLPMPPSSQVPPSPREDSIDHPMQLHRSHSAGGAAPPSYRSQGPLKRSFWHHASSGDDYQSSIPHDFMPPKRNKVNSSSRRDYVMTARTHPEDTFSPERGNTTHSHRSPPGWFNRAMSWEAREEYYRREPGSKIYADPWSRSSPPYREGANGQRWTEAPHNMRMPRPRYSPQEGGHYEGAWGSRWYHPDDRGWGVPQNRDEAESKHMGQDFQEREGYDDVRRQGTFESSTESEPPIRYIRAPPLPRGMDSSPHASSSRGMKAEDSAAINMSKAGNLRLLALPEDRISLSETLCLVRENIEVFTATLEDVEAPAPGRKHAVVVGQVGLRCIHCRHTTRSSERVKRAVCYPSSIKRIYRTVIDMKLDHFIHCKFVPSSLKDTLAALKANNTRSTGTTMQYFIRAAATLGMVDGPSGVRLAGNNPVSRGKNDDGSPGSDEKTFPCKKENPSDGSPIDRKDSIDGASQLELPIPRNNSISSEGSATSTPVDDSNAPKELFTGKVPLSLPEDKMSLSPLRCFLRDQVCAFSATEEDIAVRTPTTFSVSVGQVGIGCIHCLSQPAKMRLNRAVCFPFSIARIYQSVADIQRFHLGECKLVPPDVKAKFLELQSASSKGSKGLATRQYWVTSAKKIGLVDTSKGIRFSRDPSVPEAKAVSLDILAQVASNVTTVNRPLVLPEDKPFIAEFLYVVMEQLQPCRFTEADRNKRRLKDVGCIGVECKHCAGQVDSRKFFWSSVNAVESNFVSVHTHMMECRMIPDPLKEKFAELKGLRKEQTSALKTGSQKAFFSRVWDRLHKEDCKKREKEQQEKKEEEEEEGSEGKEEQQSPEVMSTDSADALMSPPESPMTPTAKPKEEKKETDEKREKPEPASPASSEKISMHRKTFHPEV